VKVLRFALTALLSAEPGAAAAQGVGLPLAPAGLRMVSFASMRAGRSCRACLQVGFALLSVPRTGAGFVIS